MQITLHITDYRGTRITYLEIRIGTSSSLDWWRSLRTPLFYSHWTDGAGSSWCAAAWLSPVLLCFLPQYLKVITTYITWLTYFNVFVVDPQWLVITLAMLGKLSITASYGAVYIFSTEQFPTVIRNAGLGAGSTCARLGSIIAPFFNILVSF